MDVIALKTKDEGMEIDLTAYPVGVYFVRLTGIGESITKKVIKQ